jgi:hypothetical protein
MLDALSLVRCIVIGYIIYGLHALLDNRAPLIIIYYTQICVVHSVALLG